MADVRESMSRDRRRHARARVAAEAMLEIGLRPPAACRIYDISVGGALVGHADGVRLGEAAVLHLDGHGPVRGHVARVSSTALGIAFEPRDPPALAAYLARRFGLAAPEALIPTAVPGRSRPGTR